MSTAASFSNIASSISLRPSNTAPMSCLEMPLFAARWRRNRVATTSPVVLAFTARPLTGLDRFSQKGPTRWLPQGSSCSPSKSFRMLGLSVLVSAKRRLCGRLPKIRSSTQSCRSLENTGRQAIGWQGSSGRLERSSRRAGASQLIFGLEQFQHMDSTGRARG